jgi:hypothetical protein
VADLYLDHNVPLGLAPVLTAAGHRVTSARSEQQTRAGDSRQLLVAVQTRRILVTQDRDDFVLLHDAWRLWPSDLGVSFPAHPGILVLEQARLEAQYEALRDLLSSLAAEALPNELFWWRSAHGWGHRIVESGWEPYSP